MINSTFSLFDTRKASDGLSTAAIVETAFVEAINRAPSMTGIFEHSSVITAADNLAFTLRGIMTSVLTMLKVNVDVMVTGHCVENENTYQCGSKNNNVPQGQLPKLKIIIIIVGTNICFLALMYNISSSIQIFVPTLYLSLTRTVLLQDRV